MSKKQSQETPAEVVVDGIRLDDNGRPVFSAEEFKEIKLTRVWARPIENARPLIGLFLKRSGDVRSLFPSDLPGQENTALYVWAVELLADYASDPEATCCLNEGDKPVSMAAGSLIYMFEPRTLRDALASVSQARHPMWLRSVSLEPHPKKRGRKMWVWEAKRIERPVRSLIGVDNAVLPTAETAQFAPRGAAFVEG